MQRERYSPETHLSYHFREVEHPGERTGISKLFAGNSGLSATLLIRKGFPPLGSKVLSSSESHDRDNERQHEVLLVFSIATPSKEERELSTYCFDYR